MEWLDNPVFTTWDSNTSLWSNTLITLYMTAGTMLFSTLIGVPLGLLLFETSGARGGLARWVNRVVGFVVNVGRSSYMPGSSTTNEPCMYCFSAPVGPPAGSVPRLGHGAFCHTSWSPAYTSLIGPSAYTWPMFEPLKLSGIPLLQH